MVYFQLPMPWLGSRMKIIGLGFLKL
ncbi:hypothetical protein LINPERHAP1_LOCUS7996 [Linum perenne]